MDRRHQGSIIINGKGSISINGKEQRRTFKGRKLQVRMVEQKIKRKRHPFTSPTCRTTFPTKNSGGMKISANLAKYDKKGNRIDGRKEELQTKGRHSDRTTENNGRGSSGIPLKKTSYYQEGGNSYRDALTGEGNHRRNPNTIHIHEHEISNTYTNVVWRKASVWEDNNWVPAFCTVGGKENEPSNEITSNAKEQVGGKESTPPTNNANQSPEKSLRISEDERSDHTPSLPLNSESEDHLEEIAEHRRLTKDEKKSRVEARILLKDMENKKSRDLFQRAKTEWYPQAMENTTLFCVLGVATIFLFYIWRLSNWLWFKPKRMEKFLKDQGLKGTPYKFLFGDMKEMKQMMTEATSKPMNLTHDITPRVLPFYHKALTTFGKICFTWIGTMPVVHITEPSMIREILANFRKFQKPRGGNPLRKLLFSGLVYVEGDQWVKRRKIVNPAFHVEKLKHMVSAFYVSCSEMIEQWEKVVNTESSCEVDVWPYLQNLSSDVISRTAFGSSFEEGRKIFELQREQAALVRKAISSLYIPGSRFLPTKNNKRMKEIENEVRGSIKSIINKRVIAMKAGEASHDDLLGILLDSNYNEIKEHENNSLGLSIDEIIEECKLFYFAGQETTGNMLGWTMILLGLHSEWQTYAREEVLHVFRDKTLDTDGLRHLKVMDMIFNEVLRLYAPVVAVTRQVYEETKLGNLTLPAGTIVQVQSLISHHNKDTWGEDVNEFKPERFSEGVSKATKGQSVYLPFSGGPRICIGQNFAILEAKMALAIILQNFSFKLSPSYSHAPSVMVTLQAQFGAQMIMHKL
ncbi:hypothetical protein L1987_79108 [Smallanthus sonchifolius]|uniref:Uncharacterized protein n=1 Tax=Smallanthus sonchifolius TaxID=185202 RepID=A0ACB8ZFJ7_9ASTR|nr:hypothetical protein L1987_79108 [Smallanthus sonchifolius]